MTFVEMKYWNGWHELMAETDRKVAEKMKGKDSGK